MRVGEKRKGGISRSSYDRTGISVVHRRNRKESYKKGRNVSKIINPD